jgi:thiamine pyrophosphate-dependent acetolactate synthase large subunit-like protein
MQRIEAFRAIAPSITADDLVTTSIGATWDDWWNLKPADNTFFTGVLGSVTSTALGLAISLPHRRIVAFESDGSMLMNTGILCTLGAERPPNLTVLVFDNGIYENIGGPPTLTSKNTDLARMADGRLDVGSLITHSVGLDEVADAFDSLAEPDAHGKVVVRPWLSAV